MRLARQQLDASCKKGPRMSIPSSSVPRTIQRLDQGPAAVPPPWTHPQQMSTRRRAPCFVRGRLLVFKRHRKRVCIYPHLPSLRLVVQCFGQQNQASRFASRKSICAYENKQTVLLIISAGDNCGATAYHTIISKSIVIIARNAHLISPIFSMVLNMFVKGILNRSSIDQPLCSVRSSSK